MLNTSIHVLGTVIQCYIIPTGYPLKLYIIFACTLATPSSQVMLQCTSGSTDGQRKGLITTVYSVEWISPRPAQTSRPPESKQSIGCIIFFTLCPTWAVFLSDRTVSACISPQQDSRQYGNYGYMRYMCPLKKIISLSGTISST